MKTRAELKAMAKEQIRGHIGVLFLIALVIALITGAVSSIAGVGQTVSAFIITPAFSLSTILIYLNLVKGQKPEVKDAFNGFNDFWTAFKATFLTGLFTFLWSLLFVIPGIVKSYSYSQVLYIVAENPKISAREAIKRSMAMTEGHKMELFVLDLSFLGWAFLGLLTLGIAYIWVGPYINATKVNFYNEIKPAEPVIEVAAEEVSAE